MNELRWILIGFGIVLLAGIYLWGRRGGAAVAEDVVLRSRPEPSLQPHGFTEVRREVVAPVDEIPDYEPEDAEPEQPSAQRDVVESEHLTTAARPASLRSERRTSRAELAANGNLEPARPIAREPSRVFTKDPLPDDAEVPRPAIPDYRRGRVEPTLGSDDATAELSATQTLPAASPSSRADDSRAAPTLSSGDTPAPRRSEKRKILSLRLSLAPQRVEGARLQEVLHGELLEHGKYEVFHRLHEGQSVFSIASMVEPGTFDPEKMTETLYPGVTLFAQLPGPVPGMHALNEMVACARRLHQSLGGVLQDDRGVPLTVHRIERMRQEVREFERPPGTGSRTGRGDGPQE